MPICTLTARTSTSQAQPTGPSISVVLAELHAVVRGVEVGVGAGVAALDVFSDSQDALRLLTGLGGKLLADEQVAACLTQLEPLREQV